MGMAGWGGKQASDALEPEGGPQGCPCLRSSEERLCRAGTPSAEKGHCLAGAGTSEGMPGNTTTSGHRDPILGKKQQVNRKELSPCLSVPVSL